MSRTNENRKYFVISVLRTNVTFNTSRSVFFGAYLLAPAEQPAWHTLQDIFFEQTQNAINMAYLLTFSVLILQQKRVISCQMLSFTLINQVT
jgi:hypothetical protein